MIEQAQATVPTAGRQAFFLDGTTVRTSHTPEIRQAYPPALNQHGESHWPVLRMLVAHDLDTGLALRPEWDNQQVSEQQLVERLLDRLPSEAILVGDINFGVFRWLTGRRNANTRCCCVCNSAAHNGSARNRCGMASTGRSVGSPRQPSVVNMDCLLMHTSKAG